MESYTVQTKTQRITTFYKPIIVTEHELPENVNAAKMVLHRPDSWVNL